MASAGPLPAELSPQRIAALLRAHAGAVRLELEALPAEAHGWHPGPDEWCVKEVVGHIIEAERRGFAGRIRIIREADGPRLFGWDQLEVARQRRDCDADLADLLREFLEQREASVGLVAGLHEADLERGGEHDRVGWLTIRDLIHEWVHHDRNHQRQILANTQAYVWPRMGGSQRFSAD